MIYIFISLKMIKVCLFPYIFPCDTVWRLFSQTKYFYSAKTQKKEYDKIQKNHLDLKAPHYIDNWIYIGNLVTDRVAFIYHTECKASRCYLSRISLEEHSGHLKKLRFAMWKATSVTDIESPPSKRKRFIYQYLGSSFREVFAGKCTLKNNITAKFEDAIY